MYIKYVPITNSDNNNDNIQRFLRDIEDVINGVKTDPSQFNPSICNTAASVVIGTMPAVYTNCAFDSDTGTSNLPNSLRFTKKCSDTTRDWKKRIGIYWENSTYDGKVRFYDADMDIIAGDSDYTNNNYNTSGAWPNDFQSRYHVYTNAWDNDIDGYEAFHIYFGMDSFIFQAINDNHYMNAFAMFDREPNAQDTYITDRFYPQYAPVVGFAYSSNNWNQDSYNTFSTYMELGNFGYISNSDANEFKNIRTYSYQNESFGPNSVWTNSNASQGGQGVFSFMPAMGHSIVPFHADSEVLDHVVQPVYNSPSHYWHDTTEDLYGSGQWGRIKGLFRTSDNLAETGTQITYNGTQYTVFRMHKTGALTHNNGNCYRHACYLVPTE